MTPINPKQKSLLNSLALINVKQFIELERVKKPSAIVIVAARLICQFFAIFGNKSLTQHDLVTGEWISL